MSYEKVKRNRYYDPPSEYSHSSRNHAEDLQEFHLPMERMHYANLHDWGIARGLEVSGTIGGTEVVINPGVAIDGNGQLMSLSSAGHGDSGANPPGGQHNEVTVPVHLGLGSHAGQTVYVTIQFSEIMRPAEGSGGRMEQVPWVRLQPTAGAGAYVDDGTSIILAIVIISAGGSLTELKERDAALPYRRRLIGETLEELRIQRSTKVGNNVQEVTSGKVKPGDGGGLQITVPNTGDKVLFSKEDGGNFAKMSIAAGQIAARRSDGKESVVIDTQLGNITAGTNGVEGDILVKDASNRLVITLDGDDAVIVVGAAGNEGDVIVKDNTGQDSARIDGSTGTLNIKRIAPYGNVLDIDAPYVRIHGYDLVLDGLSGGNKRALVDGNNKLIINYANDYANGVETPGDLKVLGTLRARVDGRDRILGGNPARYVHYRFLCADDGTVTEELNLGSPRSFTAFVSIIGMDPRHDFDHGDAFAVDVFTVDGNMTPWHFKDGAHFGPEDSATNIRAPFVTGTGQRIVFRARSFQNATVLAIGVVFYE